MTNTTGKLTIMAGMAKKTSDPGKQKGELMEANADAMEYSSEEEEEDLESTMAGLQRKKKVRGAHPNQKNRI